MNEVEADLTALHTVQLRRRDRRNRRSPPTPPVSPPPAKIPVDNGAPLSDAALVLDTTAGSSLRAPC